MMEISATEAGRHLGKILDEIEERGETFVIRRNGKMIARIEPARANGAAVKELLRRMPDDPDWAREIRELR